MDIKIIVATHKQYPLLEDDRYLPVFVGAASSDLDLPYQRDDEGENISIKNPYYSELTGLYWAYKNLKADYIGLCHYHRYMDLSDVVIENCNVILPKKRHYYIETIYDQYRHAHGSMGLETAREIIEKDHSEYLEYFDRHMTKTSEHNCNMFIMKYNIFIDYCDFLFDILFKIEEKLGNINRLYGYISERLLDVYIDKNGYKYKEVKVIETEHINWPKKIYEFLKRKYNKKEFYLVIKRIMDILFSLLMLIPLILLIIAVKIIYLFSGDNKHVIYRQNRVGKQGKLFEIYKIRTMTPDADKQLSRLLKNSDKQKEWEEYHKFKDDPRVTPIGLFLRKTSIDEFPQFINVLKGDMSVIGPRPLIEGELELHNGDKKYWKVRPGITGWWACNGRSNMKYDERLQYEYYYVDNVSLLLDMKVFFKTISCLLQKDGSF